MEELVVGAWCALDKASEESSKVVIDWIVRNKSKLQKLKALYIGDFTYEFIEISWMILCDYTPIFKSLPNLMSYEGRGMNELSINHFSSLNLRRICLITGGLPSSVLNNLLDCDLPNLNHLELWLGRDDYGADYANYNFKKLFSTEENGIFPSLNYLGIKYDEIHSFRI